MQNVRLKGKRRFSRRLTNSLFYATSAIDSVSAMYEEIQTPQQWQKTIMGHTFSVARSSTDSVEYCPKAIVTNFASWLRAHEEAQVMLASILVVVGIWWLVRTVLTLVINLVLPFFVVLTAVVCVPQLRGPLLGQNYPALAQTLKNILTRLADNIQT